MHARWTAERIVYLEQISDPQMAPDGKRVAFVRGLGHRRGPHPSSRIWIVDVEGPSGVPTGHAAPARPFTSGAGCDDHPRWSPDGNWLAFLSDRGHKDERHVYLMPSAAGEARPLCALPGKVSDLRWRPDSRAIGFLREDPWPPDVKRRREELGDDEIVTDRDERCSRLWLAGIDGSPARQVSPPDLHVWSFDFSPDGQQAVLCCTTGPSLDEQMLQNDLIVLDLASGTTRRLCPTVGVVPLLRWSPDGRLIAFRAGDGEEYIGGAVRVCPAAGGESTRLLEDFEGDANWLEWLPDGRLAVAAFVDMATRLIAVRPERQAKPELLVPEDSPTIGSAPLTTTFDRSGRVLATTGETAQRPREVFVGAVGGSLRRRTFVHAPTEALEQGEVRRVSWAAEGQRLSGLLYLPVGYVDGQQVPLVLQVHGGPASHYIDGFRAGPLSWAPLLAANGYAVLLANPRGSGGRGRAFARANFRDWGGGDYRDVQAGVDHIIDLGIADPERLGICGWSYGGYMSAWTINQTNRFKAAVIGAAIANLWSFQGTTDIARGFIPAHYTGEHPYREPAFWHERSPLEHIAAARTPSLILCGEQDARVPIGQSWELYRALRSLGVETQFVRYPREEHGFHERSHQVDVQRRVLGWFDRFV